MWISYGLNDYGTPISVHECATCKNVFTVCSAKAPEDEGWDGCMALNCGTYNRSRDANILFAQSKVRRRGEK